MGGHFALEATSNVVRDAVIRERRIERLPAVAGEEPHERFEPSAAALPDDLRECAVVRQRARYAEPRLFEAGVVKFFEGGDTCGLALEQRCNGSRLVHGARILLSFRGIGRRVTSIHADGMTIGRRPFLPRTLSKLILAEFDYDGNPAPSIPIIDTSKERWSMYILKRHFLP